MQEDDLVFTLLIVIGLGLMSSIASLSVGAFAFVASLGFILVTIGILSTVYLVTSDASLNIVSDTDENITEETVNPVNKLQERYAEGEISEEEFEHKLDQIVDSQEIADKVDDEKVEILDT